MILFEQNRVLQPYHVFAFSEPLGFVPMPPNRGVIPIANEAFFGKCQDAFAWLVDQLEREGKSFLPP